MTFAERLREPRDEAGLSEAKLAEKSGVPFGTVHEYGLGRRAPSFANVLALAKALGKACEDFAGCDDVTPAGGRGSVAKKKPAPRAGRPKRN